MTRYEVKMKYKEIQKNRATKIHNLKSSRKLDENGNREQALWKIESEILSLKDEFRYYHIALSMLRGRTYEQIENKCAEGNSPNFYRIEKIQEKITEEITEPGTQVEEVSDAA